MLKSLTIWSAIKIGGPVMYFLIICSVLSISVILEKFFNFYRRSRVPRARFMQSVREEIGKGDVKNTLKLCQNARMPFAAVIGAGINAAALDLAEATEAMERQIIIEISELERRTVIVGTIGSTAVYIGLLGTVWGIIKTFQDISQAGSGGINVVIHGISEALVCTAAGLFVAIPAVMAHNYFVRRISKFVTDMELVASETASIIKGLKKR